MNRDWFVGQKIVCVDGKRRSYPWGGHGWETLPIPGAIYTIREIVPDKHGPSVRLLLNEITNAPAAYLMDGFCEAGFHPSRFRPVIDAECDLAVFEAILRGVNQRKVVEA